MFYLTTHSTHFIYGYMASDIWLRTILIVRKESRCRHIGYSYRLTARVLLYAPSHRQDNTYHGLCYISRGALAGTKNSSMGIYVCMYVCLYIYIYITTWKEGNVLINDALHTFYLRLSGVGHAVKDHSDSERENLLRPLHRLLFPISSTVGFFMHHPSDRIAHTTTFVIPVMEYQWVHHEGSIRRPIAP